jgi:sigma-B regulation protein RsbU (phosphoserine phosphatase)
VADGITYARASVRLTPGDCLVIYTDGVTEAFNPQDQEFGQERLPAIFSLRHSAGAQEVVNQVIAAVDAFAAGAPQSDDVTCVVLHAHPRRTPLEPVLTKELLA